MKAVLFLIALAGCAQTESTTYQDVCRTTRTLCSAADLLCLFAPRSGVHQGDTREKRREALRQIDSLSTLIQKQIKQLEAE